MFLFSKNKERRWRDRPLTLLYPLSCYICTRYICTPLYFNLQIRDFDFNVKTGDSWPKWEGWEVQNFLSGDNTDSENYYYRLSVRTGSIRPRSWCRNWRGTALRSFSLSVPQQRFPSPANHPRLPPRRSARTSQHSTIMRSWRLQRMLTKSVTLLSLVVEGRCISG